MFSVSTPLNVFRKKMKFLRLSACNPATSSIWGFRDGVLPPGWIPCPPVLLSSTELICAMTGLLFLHFIESFVCVCHSCQSFCSAYIAVKNAFHTSFYYR